LKHHLKGATKELLSYQRVMRDIQISSLIFSMKKEPYNIKNINEFKFIERKMIYKTEAVALKVGG